MDQDVLENCCQKFDTSPWDETYHSWHDKKFIKSSVRQVFHMPINYSKVITAMMSQIDLYSAKPEGADFIMLSSDVSAWKSDLYVSVTRIVPNANNVTISGNFMSKVFDGPYKSIPKWLNMMQEYVTSQGHQVKKYYFYYTTCPKCAKKYGHNYVVIFAEV